MPPRPISRSPDLTRLREEGYEVEVRGAYLLVHHVPYVTASRAVAYGTLVSPLTLAGDTTASHPEHVVQFGGEMPCDAQGESLERLVNGGGRQNLGHGIQVDFSFSHKPPTGYADYYDKMTAYVAMLGTFAAGIAPDATARTYRVIEEREDGSPFLYPDTATSRAGIGAASEKLAVDRLAIVGLGGTGSYILDLVAKTHVREIHLFDGDRFMSHNAFRAPGPTSAEELDGAPNKAEHFASKYCRMRDGVIAHPYHIEETNLGDLAGMAVVFLALDPTPAKRAIVEYLEAEGIAFVESGIGVPDAGGALGGMIRVTTGIPGQPVSHRGWIPFGDAGVANEYATNIQVADLNALAASLAVIRWKRTLGFYRDLEGELHMLYTIDGNRIDNAGDP